ncbi:MAG: HEAT repeat domain-containing protein [Acidimicrobiia bacterium]|nr:HEAT repeat domain-containing protein [Acidimicrobiia bacterium]MYC45816.1 HEAT repeat domain-containing protein [Acidimicrobiia bacterium]MYI20640.1 HEAT repeat domain-containing protein [Acidimicrobiia bacterium]
MGFKEDADFARFVSMGAVGAAAVAFDLSDEYGHRMVELERYAMANKVWQTKVKRLRLPDLLCVRCGLRVEARAKSKLGIVLSHSDVPGREWDAGGMRDGDLFAFIRTDLSHFPPYAGTPVCFAKAALKASISQARRSAPKAASEGSESTLTWPCWVPSRPGRFRAVDADGRICYDDENGTPRTYWHWRNWTAPRHVYLESGDSFAARETIVAGVVEAARSLSCDGDTWDIGADLHSSDPVDRHAAVRAVGMAGRLDLLDGLAGIEADTTEDWRTRLEARANLARLDPVVWAPVIADGAIAGDVDTEQRMEAVFALTELPDGAASSALARIAGSSDLSSEVRAAAAWGLGQGSVPRPDFLIHVGLDSDETVALHALASIEELPDSAQDTLVDWLSGEDARRAEVAVCLLARHRCIDRLLDASQASGQARLLALRALGDLPREAVRLHAGERLTPELTAILEPMWYGQGAWLRTTGQEGLDALDVQKVRFDPAAPRGPRMSSTD